VFALLFLSVVTVLGGYELYLRFHYGYLGLGALEFSTRYSILWPAFFVVLAYEFFSLPRRNHTEESIESLPGAAHQHWLSSLSVLAGVVALMFSVYLALRLVVVFSSSVTRHLLSHVVLAAALDVLLPTITSVLLAFVLAKRTNRFGGYALIMLFLFLIGPYGEMLPFVFLQATLDSGQVLNLYPLYDYIMVLPPDPTWFISPLYGFPIEFKRWAVAFFWLSIFAATALLALRPRRRAATSVSVSALVFVAALCFGMALLPGSELRRDHRPDGANHADTVYYSYQESQHPQKDVAPDFAITSYEMEFEAARRLRGEVTAHIARGAHGSVYRFTLYHGYELSRVSSLQGESLSFEQEGDYVTVHSESGLDGIRFEYVGDGKGHVTNHQGLFLPGYFPYYPLPGFVPLWDEQRRTVAVPASLRTETDFVVKFTARVPVFSNLPIRNGVFAGRTTAPSFVGGLVAERLIGDTRIVYYPAAGEDASSFEATLARLDDLSSRLGVENPCSSDCLTLLQDPGLVHMGGPVVAIGDSLFVGMFGPEMAPDLLLAQTPHAEDRLLLRDAFIAYLSYPDDFKAEAESAGLPDSQTIAALENARLAARDQTELILGYQRPATEAVRGLFYERIRREGEDAALNRTYHYLASGDGPSELVFLTTEPRETAP